MADDSIIQEFACAAHDHAWEQFEKLVERDAKAAVFVRNYRCAACGRGEFDDDDFITLPAPFTPPDMDYWVEMAPNDAQPSCGCAAYETRTLITAPHDEYRVCVLCGRFQTPVWDAENEEWRPWRTAVPPIVDA